MRTNELLKLSGPTAAEIFNHPFIHPDGEVQLVLPSLNTQQSLQLGLHKWSANDGVC